MKVSSWVLVSMWLGMRQMPVISAGAPGQDSHLTCEYCKVKVNIPPTMGKPIMYGQSRRSHFYLPNLWNISIYDWFHFFSRITWEVIRPIPTVFLNYNQLLDKCSIGPRTDPTDPWPWYILNHSNRYMCNILERCDLFLFIYLSISSLQINIDICRHICSVSGSHSPASLRPPAASTAHNWNSALSPLHSSPTRSWE